MARFPKKAACGLLAGALAALGVAALGRTGLVARWEAPLADWRARTLARPSPATGQVKLVLLDQESLDWGSQAQGLSWPWPREVYGPLLDYLKRNEAKTAAFDVLYTEPSAYGVPDDEALGAAVARFGNFVGAVFLGRQTEQTATWPAFAKPSPIEIQGLDAWLAAHPEAAVLSRLLAQARAQAAP